MGELGWGYSDFYEADLRSAVNAIVGYNDRRFEEAKLAYEVSRYNAALQISVQMPKGKHIKDPKELGEFSWEKPVSKKKNLSKEEISSIMKKMDSPKVVKKEKLDGKQVQRFITPNRN